jgi:hypothetical protein
MVVTPDVKRFSQAMKHQFPSFRSYFHPSVQNWSTLQLIYHITTPSEELIHVLTKAGQRFQRRGIHTTSIAHVTRFVSFCLLLCPHWLKRKLSGQDCPLLALQFVIFSRGRKEQGGTNI